MPFGLCNAPATFQRCMSAVFHGFCEEIVEVFMDLLSLTASQNLCLLSASFTVLILQKAPTIN
jgi:hypothetical protein